MKMQYTEEQIARANQTDLVSFLNEQGEQLVKSGREYRKKKSLTSCLPTCPLREEKSFSQRAFSIYTDIRKLQDKAKTSYTLSTRRLRFGYE